MRSRVGDGLWLRKRWTFSLSVSFACICLTFLHIALRLILSKFNLHLSYTLINQNEKSRFRVWFAHIIFDSDLGEEVLKCFVHLKKYLKHSVLKHEDNAATQN